MTTRNKLLWTFVPAIVLSTAGWMAFQCHASMTNLIGGILLMPGLILGVITMGALGPVGLAVGAVLGWALVIYLLVCIIEPLAEAIKRHTR